jgi:glycosyltransferase involved in cell wall biosynthesis
MQPERSSPRAGVHVPARSEPDSYRLGILSSWNTKCGIAEYSRYLREALEAGGADTEIFTNSERNLLGDDGAGVFRCWENTDATLNSLVRKIQERKITRVLIQYHNGFYAPDLLASLIDRLSAMDAAVFVTHHITHHDGLPKIVEALARVAVNLVHSRADVDRLKALGLNNVVLLQHGNVVPPETGGDARQNDGAFTIGGFGFLLPHKGFLELICAGYLLRRHIPKISVKIYASVYPNWSSEKLLTRCREYIRFLRCADYVSMETDYLDVADLIGKLRGCDLIVFPYQHTKESSSAAVRMGLAAKRPVLCTPLPIFGDAGEAVNYAAGFDALAISASILELYRDPGMLHLKDAAQREYLDAHTWANVARQLREELAAYEPEAAAP